MAAFIKPVQTDLNWEVVTDKLYTKEGFALSDYKMLRRSDNMNLLNVCKKSYTPTTNEKFKETVGLMSEITRMDFTGYSEMGGGKKILAYLKAEGKTIGGFDFDNYMVIGNSHDYSTGFFIASSHEMLRCQNQFSRLYKGSMFTIPHTSQVETRIDELVTRFESFMEEQRRLERKLGLWKQIEIDQSLREMMIERVFNLEMGYEESLSGRTKNKVELLNSSFDREMGDIGENLLGLFQGVTHYTTHVHVQKEKAYGGLFGTVAEINNRAFSFSEQVESGYIDNLEMSVN